MTGRELIVYILQNNLEDEEIELDSGFFGFLTETEAAVKFKVGMVTMRAWCMMDLIDCIKVGDDYYIRPDALPPTLKRESTG